MDVRSVNRLPSGIVLTSIALATAVVVAALIVRDTSWLFEIDFKVYHLGGSAVLAGVSPYDVTTVDGNPFSYPPFAALTFVPLGLMNGHVAFAVWTFATVLALEISIWLALGLLDPESPLRRARFAILATAAALPTAPVLLNLGVGQINVLLMLLVIADLARRPGRFQGVAIGIAAGIKLTPLIFIAYLLLTRRIRAAVVAAATFVATMLVGFLVLPGPSARWWGELAMDAERMSPPGAAPFNQSMRGVLAHLPGVLSASWLWLTLAIVVGLAGLAISVWAARRRMAAAGVMACAVTALLVSPVSWTFHWVWIGPALALWLWWGRSRQSMAQSVAATLVWLVLVTSGVLTLVISLRVPSLAAAGELMPTSLTVVVVLNSLTMLAGLGYLGVLARTLSRLKWTVNVPV